MKKSKKSPRPRAIDSPASCSPRIAYLGDVGAIAPMLGLLGTTLGMITTFHEISGKVVGGSNQLGLAQGVSEASSAQPPASSSASPPSVLPHFPRQGEPSDL